MAETRKSAQNDIDMEQLKAVHRGAMRGHGLYAALLVIAGLGLITATLMGYIPWYVGLLTGIMTLVVSVLPMRQFAERRERLQGFDVLADDWRDLKRIGDPGAQEQFLALIQRMYTKS